MAQIKLETYSFSRAQVLSFHGQEALQHCTLSDTRHTSSDLLLALREDQNFHLNLWESLSGASYMCGTSNAIPGKLGKQARGATWNYIIFFTEMKEKRVKNKSEL